jgi:hypothetical protein
MNRTTIQIDKQLHKRLRIISAFSGKKLYELIKESAEIMEDKYNVPQNTNEDNNV